MSVYASQRKKSEMQFMATALKLQDEILGRWEHNFGIKFTKRVYDRATGEITTNRLEPYKRWLAEEMAKRMITTVNDMVDSIYRANCIYPAFNFEVEDRRRMINQAIQDCEALQGQMRALVRNFQLDVNKMMPIVGMILERVPQRLISDKVLIPVLSNSLIYDNGASLKDKGLHFSLNRLVAQLQKYHRSKNKDPNGYVSGRDPSGYILQIDFRHFFDSIPHKEVYRLLEEKFKDPTIRRIMHQLVDAFGPERSLGIGSQVSQIMAVSFPNSIDHYIKEKLGIQFYGRYMDDLYLIHEDKEYLKKCLEGIRIEVAKIGLEVNDRKTHISRIDRWFTFLKFKFKLEPTGKVAIRPSRDNIVRERRKLKKLQPKVEAGEIPFGAVEQQYESFKAHLSFASCRRTVRHMDRLFNDLYIKEWRKPYGRKKDNRTPEGRHSDRRFRQHPKPDSNV